MRISAMTRAARTTVICASLVVFAASCSEKDTTPTGPASTTAAAGESPSATTTGLSVESLAAQCDDLAPIIAKLRAEKPQQIKPQALAPVSTGGFKSESSHCTFAYQGDSFTDKNRIEIYIDTAGDDAAGMKAYWDRLATTEALTGIDGTDAAAWYTNRGADASAAARALIGDTVISVRVSVPKSMAGEPFMNKDAVASALQSVIALR